MKVREIFFIVFILCLLFVMFSVSAQSTPFQFSPEQQQLAAKSVGAVNQIIAWIFGSSDITFGMDLILYLAVFIILAILFCDALINFSPLSRRAAIAVGLLLTFITSFTGGIRDLARLMLGLSGVFGAFGAAVSIAFAFGAYFLIHWIFSILGKFTKKSVKKKMEDAAEGVESLVEFTRRLRGGKK